MSNSQKLGSLYAVKLARLVNLEEAWSCGHPSSELYAELVQLRAEVLELAGEQLDEAEVLATACECQGGTGELCDDCADEEREDERHHEFSHSAGRLG